LAADVRAARQGVCGMLAGELLEELPELIQEFYSGTFPPTEEQVCCRLVKL